jgi:hypothetical protein
MATRTTEATLTLVTFCRAVALSTPGGPHQMFADNAGELATAFKADHRGA